MLAEYAIKTNTDGWFPWFLPVKKLILGFHGTTIHWIYNWSTLYLFLVTITTTLKYWQISLEITLLVKNETNLTEAKLHRFVVYILQSEEWQKLEDIFEPNNKFW